MSKVLGPIVKKFLVDFVGERFYTFDSEIYRMIEMHLRVSFMYVGIAFNSMKDYRTIKEPALWDEERNQFESKNAKFNWAINKDGYNIELFKYGDIEIFLRDLSESLTPESHEITMKINSVVLDLLKTHVRFSSFIQQACELLITEIKKYTEDSIAFELTYLSTEGYELLQLALDEEAKTLFRNLYVLTHY